MSEAKMRELTLDDKLYKRGYDNACAHKDAEFAKEREQLHETANKWLAKCDELDTEREQLRAEIAMQAEALKPFGALLQGHNSAGQDDNPIFAINDAMITLGDLRNTNKAILASAESVAELKAKVLEEFGEKYRCVYIVHRGKEVYVGPELKELADKEATELRAQSAQKKGGE